MFYEIEEKLNCILRVFKNGQTLIMNLMSFNALNNGELSAKVLWMNWMVIQHRQKYCQ
jgi:hypothetical protein|tara:strand:- start:505 stop:678 length:174 start_codon:yes stop_codon:yes gene_type:complete